MLVLLSLAVHCFFVSPLFLFLLLFVPFSQKHLRCLGSRLVASATEERDKASVVVDGRWVWTGLWMEKGGAQYGRCAGVDGAVDGRKGVRDGRRVGESECEYEWD